MITEKSSLKNENEPSFLGAVSDSDLKQCAELVLCFLKDRNCVSIPTRALFKVVKIIEKKDISFTFTNNPKSKWTLIHALHCHCH